MDNKVQQEISKQFMKGFVFQIIIYAVIIAAVSGAAYAWCAARIWYADDPAYPILQALHRYWVVIFFLALLLGCMIIAWINFYKIAKTIRLITNAVENLYMSAEEPIKLPRKLIEIENQMNQIRINTQLNRQAVREEEQRKNDMIMYMAHDLKTPLTTIIGYMTLLRDESGISEETRSRYIDTVLNKSIRLEELINEFFEMARFNFSHMTLEVSNVNMSVMLEQILYEFQPVFTEKGLTYNLNAEKNVNVFCDVEKMERVFDNLIKNAVNYSYEGTEINISLNRENQNGMKLIVENHGKTIPPEKTDKIFEQFFRMDSSRDSKTGGTGLGLAVVKEIVNLHNGTVTCESEYELIRFTLTI